MLDEISLLGLICLGIIVLVVELVAVILVAGLVASWLGLTGILWWAVAIVVFLLINGILGALVNG